MSKRAWYKARPVVEKVTSEATKLTYDSRLEKELHEGALAESIYHPYSIPYVVAREYHVDFVLDDKYLIEVKGFFQDTEEARKYKCVRDTLEDKELIFIFERPSSPLPWAKKRKDGTRMTHKEWAEHNNFRSFGPDVTVEEIRDVHI